MPVNVPAAIVLPVLGSLFILCFVISMRRQAARAQKRHNSWTERYGSQERQRLENKKRVWAMFGLQYNGTIDDIRQNDEESMGHYVAAAEFKSERRGTPSPPPPYVPQEDIGDKNAFDPPPNSLNSGPRPHHEPGSAILSPQPRRLMQLQPPEPAARGPLSHRPSARSTRRCSAPPIPILPAGGSGDQREYAIYDFRRSRVASPVSEPALSPRRLDSISRKQNEPDDDEN
ncbi:hypothetical protein BDZ91DRAFT_145600 [Kalaharituber pfeilii]|nr:hypothetical protein BDZ91DRAFT_145600 [Kalaharituber pfeilii]